MTASVAFPALGTTAVLCVADRAALTRARLELERELATIDLACSRFRPDSELTRLNDSAGRSVPVSTRLREAIAVALRAAELTDGLVDPTVGRSLRTLGYDRTYLLVRRRDARDFEATVSEVAGWRKVELDDERGTVRIPRGTELDLGATAKALAADHAARAAAEATGSGVLVSLGGDVSAAGEAPHGGWSVGIADVHDEPAQAAVTIAGGGLATSGTLRRRWRAGDAELHHLLDPRTGAPAVTPWRTVTVAAASCVDANVASTAAIVLAGDAPRWLEERGLPARLVGLGGSVSVVAGWPAEEEAA